MEKEQEDNLIEALRNFNISLGERKTEEWNRILSENSKNKEFLNYALQKCVTHDNSEAFEKILALGGDPNFINYRRGSERGLSLSDVMTFNEDVNKDLTPQKMQELLEKHSKDKEAAKTPLEKEKLNEAAENLRNIQFSSKNYKDLLEIINRISAIAGANRHDEEIEHIEKSETNNEIPETNPVQEENNNSPAPPDENSQEAIVFGKTKLPPFAIITTDGLKNYKNAVVEFFDENQQVYYLSNGKEKFALPKKTFESILSPNSQPKKNQFSEDIILKTESPAIVHEKTVLPEFAMITNMGLRTFKDLSVKKYNETEHSYIVSNETDTLTIPESTFKEITSPERFGKQFAENTPAHKKLLETQYESFFKDRDNTATNFRHNFSVHCRKEANSPLDALTVAKEIISRMDKAEQSKTRELLKQLAKEDESINQVLVRTYFEAIKEFPLNEEYIRQNFPEKKITRQFYDTVSDKGSLIDRDSALRIGDKIENIAFNVDKILGHGKEPLYESLTVVSASQEGNSVVLMDKNKSFYEVPRDTLLENYNRQQRKIHKAEAQHKRRNCVEIER